MARTVKNPDERRSEIIDISEELFLEKGYEQTAVSDIVKRIGVAQGTFYYYFKSKSEVLDAIIARYIEEIKAGVKDIAFREDLGAMEKLIAFSRFFSGFNQDRESLIEYIHEEKNAHLHLKFETMVPPVLIPLYGQMIEQGVSEGIFDTKYPMEAAFVIFNLVSALFERGHVLEDILGGLEERFDAAIDFIERILGVKPGTFKEYGLKWEGDSNG